jgi:hypothetical protein
METGIRRRSTMDRTDRLVSLLSTLLFLLASGCGGGSAGDGVGGRETWSGNLTGTSVPGLCDTGQFSEEYSVTLTFNTSIAKKFTGSPGGGIVTGAGTLSGTESVTQESRIPDVCVLRSSSVSNAPLDLEAAWDGDYSPSRPSILIHSSQTLIRAYVVMTAINSDVSVEVSELSLTATSVSDREMSGTWTTIGSGSASGNHAGGTFRLVKGVASGGLGGTGGRSDGGGAAGAGGSYPVGTDGAAGVGVVAGGGGAGGAGGAGNIAGGAGAGGAGGAGNIAGGAGADGGGDIALGGIAGRSDGGGAGGVASGGVAGRTDGGGAGGIASGGIASGGVAGGSEVGGVGGIDAAGGGGIVGIGGAIESGGASGSGGAEPGTGGATGTGGGIGAGGSTAAGGTTGSATAYSPDPNTILLDHFDGTTLGILKAADHCGSCGGAYPSLTPVYSYVTGVFGQALSMSSPLTGNCTARERWTYDEYPGGELASQGNGTVELWAYTDLTAGVSIDQGPFLGSCAGWTFSVGVEGSDGTAGRVFASAWNAFNINSGDARVQANTWTHIAASWGSSGTKLYINKVLVGSDANTAAPASGFGGTILIDFGKGVVASIDELRISNIQRTFP